METPPTARVANPSLLVVVQKDFTSGLPLAYNHWLMCPACQDVHRICTAYHSPTHYAGPLWDWDDNEVAPTYTPSILVQSSQAGIPQRCHSYLNSGIWQFLGDSTHELAGQTHPMIELPDWLLEEN